MKKKWRRNNTFAATVLASPKDVFGVVDSLRECVFEDWFDEDESWIVEHFVQGRRRKGSPWQIVLKHVPDGTDIRDEEQVKLCVPIFPYTRNMRRLFPGLCDVCVYACDGTRYISTEFGSYDFSGESRYKGAFISPKRIRELGLTCSFQIYERIPT